MITFCSTLPQFHSRLPSTSEIFQIFLFFDSHLRLQHPSHLLGTTITTHPTTVLSAIAMDDLLDNFAKIDSPNIDEEGYIYHFVNESPPPLEHNRPVHDTTEAEPNNYTSFFNIESPPQYQFTGGENEDEGDYNADIDDDDYDDDDVFGCGLQKTSQLGANRESSTIGASHNKERLFMNNNTTSLNHSYQTQSNGIIELHDLSGRNDSGDIKPSSALSGDEQDLDAFKQHLRKFHRQDLERDELLAVRPLPSPLDSGAC